MMITQKGWVYLTQMNRFYLPDVMVKSDTPVNAIYIYCIHYELNFFFLSVLFGYFTIYV